MALLRRYCFLHPLFWNRGAGSINHRILFYFFSFCLSQSVPLSGGQFSNRVHYIGVVFQLDQADAGLNERCFSRQGLGKAWVRGPSTIRQVQGGPRQRRTLETEPVQRYSPHCCRLTYTFAEITKC